MIRHAGCGIGRAWNSGCDRSAVGGIDDSAVASTGAAAADGHIDSQDEGTIQRKSISPAAAAAADRLQMQTRRVVAEGRDGRGCENLVDIDRPAVPAGVAFTTDAGVDQGSNGGRRPTMPTPTAHALGHDGGRVIRPAEKSARKITRDGAAIAALPALPADSNKNAGRVAAVAAAAAHALHENTQGIGSVGRERRTRLCGDRDVATLAAVAPFVADEQGRVVAAAIAAAAPDGLCDDSDGGGVPRGDRAILGDRNGSAVAAWSGAVGAAVASDDEALVDREVSAGGDKVIDQASAPRAQSHDAVGTGAVRQDGAIVDHGGVGTLGGGVSGIADKSLAGVVRSGDGSSADAECCDPHREGAIAGDGAVVRDGNCAGVTLSATIDGATAEWIQQKVRPGTDRKDTGGESRICCARRNLGTRSDGDVDITRLGQRGVFRVINWIDLADGENPDSGFSGEGDRRIIDQGDADVSSNGEGGIARGELGADIGGDDTSGRIGRVGDFRVIEGHVDVWTGLFSISSVEFRGSIGRGGGNASGDDHRVALRHGDGGVGRGHGNVPTGVSRIEGSLIAVRHGQNAAEVGRAKSVNGKNVGAEVFETDAIDREIAGTHHDNIGTRFENVGVGGATPGKSQGLKGAGAEPVIQRESFVPSDGGFVGHGDAAAFVLEIKNVRGAGQAGLIVGEVSRLKADVQVIGGILPRIGRHVDEGGNGSVRVNGGIDRVAHKVRGDSRGSSGGVADALGLRVGGSKPKGDGYEAGQNFLREWCSLRRVDHSHHKVRLACAKPKRIASGVKPAVGPFCRGLKGEKERAAGRLLALNWMRPRRIALESCRVQSFVSS